MKLRILIFLFFIPMMLVAQNMPKVVGVTFGWDYSKCKEILDRRFNAGEDSYQYEKNQLSYHGNIDFAGETFDYVVFYFQNDGFSTYLNKVTFVSRFDLSDADIAKKERERLFEVIVQKYE